MAQAARAHNICDRTQRLWHCLLYQADRCEAIQNSQIRDDLQTLSHKMELLDREYLDIEIVYNARGSISENDLTVVEEHIEEIQELVKKGMVELRKVSGVHNPADMMTKAKSMNDISEQAEKLCAAIVMREGVGLHVRV